MDYKTMQPLLSIITVTYNAEKELEKTIKSIISQENIDDLNVEYIIQDGMSKDGTLSLAKGYRESIEGKNISFSIYSEKDFGIYDAMNRGIKKATGKWICLLNAGDVFCNEKSITGIKSNLEEAVSDVLYADYRRVNLYMERTIKIPEIKELRNTMIFCHQSVFIRDYVYSKYSYDCKYALVADYDLMLRLYLNKCNFEHMSVCLVNYDIDGLSGKNMIETYREIYKVRKNNNVINRKFREHIRYMAGILKRFILANMPQSLRWFIYKKLRGL